ncbi:uncharacterized protein [Aegilops tauschii subsp. strangulata]|uniref:uncharacterized protein isoform X1 n=1 Tax=Aegilops tauschii subsp. strangulata TaxID=200361 RepID=UPI00098BA5EB
MAFVRSPSFFSYCLLRPPSRRSADCIEAVRLLLHLRWLAAVLVVLLGSGWKSCSASASAPVACCCYSRLHPVLPFQFKRSGHTTISRSSSLLIVELHEGTLMMHWLKLFS